jgi:hypothetical protein
MAEATGGSTRKISAVMANPFAFTEVDATHA